MKRDELKVGSLVRWNDPDEDKWSVTGIITDFDFYPDGMVMLVLDNDRWCREVLLEELQLVPDLQ